MELGSWTLLETQDSNKHTHITKITEYCELEGTHKDPVQLLSEQWKAHNILSALRLENHMPSAEGEVSILPFPTNEHY